MLLFIPMIADSYPTASCQYALPQIAALLCPFFSIIASRCFSSFQIQPDLFAFSFCWACCSFLLK